MHILSPVKPLMRMMFLIGEASEHDEIDPYSEKYNTDDARARLSGLNHPEAK
jgi:hypothetical protein